MNEPLLTLGETQTPEDPDFSKSKLHARFLELAENPVGEDELLRRAALGLIEITKNNDTLAYHFHQARLDRSNTGGDLPSTTAALMLLSHSVNYHFFKKGEYHYPDDWSLNHQDRATGVRNYAGLFKHLIEDDLDGYVNPLYTRNIHSTDPHRGAPLFAIQNMLCGDQPIVWADIGASAGFVAKRVAYPTQELQQLDPFQVNDQTPGGLVAKYIDQRANIQQLLAVDPINPLEDEHARIWFTACRMPGKVTSQDIVHTQQQIATYSHLSTPGYNFQKGDMTHIPIDPGTCNLVTAFTVLTHMSENHRIEGIEKMLALLDPNNPRSTLVVQDYLEHSKEKPYGISKVTKRPAYAYGTWLCGQLTGGKLMQLFKFDNSVCRGVVLPGDDYQYITDAIASSA